MEKLASIWILTPDFILILFLSWLGLILLKRLSFWFVPKIASLIMLVLEVIWYCMFSALIFVFQLMVDKDSKFNSVINSIENSFIKVGKKVIRLKKTFFGYKALFLRSKKYGWLTFALALVIALSFLMEEESAIYSPWNSVNQWVMGEALDSSNMSAEEAKANLFGESALSETKDFSQKETKVKYKLIEERDGGNLREAPVESLDINNSILTINKQHELIFLGERKELGGVPWMKVKTNSDVVGWISENIIEEIE